MKHVTRNPQNTRATTTVFRIGMGNERLHITNQVCQVELHKHVKGLGKQYIGGGVGDEADDYIDAGNFDRIEQELRIPRLRKAFFSCPRRVPKEL